MTIPTHRVPIERVEGFHTTAKDDVLAIEEALEIRLGGKSLSVTMRTPGHDFELAAGFLVAEGIVAHADEIEKMTFPADGNPNVVEVWLEGGTSKPGKLEMEAVSLDTVQRGFLTTSACGMCGKSSLEAIEASRTPMVGPDTLLVDPEILHSLPARLRREQAVFASTGGLHAAAAFTQEGELECVREDVGRHNAVDKLVGQALLNSRLPMDKQILLVSGRAGFELVQKALVAGIPMMAAVGAPTSLAVANAARCGMTLIGFLRDARFNVYCGGHRIGKGERPH